jgi:hypothetical protein
MLEKGAIVIPFTANRTWRWTARSLGMTAFLVFFNPLGVRA